MTGQTISHYRILEKLGEGGMGVVYKAEDTQLGRPVALKFLSPHLVSNGEVRKRFIREARTAAALQHPNICTVHEIGEANGHTFIAMAYLEGRELADEIAEGPLDPGRALDLTLQFAEGLAVAHRKGVVHRDIKPANLFVTSDGRGVILDFGLAQLASAEAKLTRDGTTLGTCAYMSPEQAEGAEVGPPTDVWALGCVLYEMLAGRQPFGGHFEQAIVYSILNEAPQPLAEQRQDVPEGLEQIVAKCLSKQARERAPSATELAGEARALKNLLESGADRRAPSGEQDVSPSVAVLPFENRGRDEDDEYLSDGIAEEIINALTKLDGLQVAARSSAFHFKGKKAPLEEVAEKLHVGAVVEGTVRRSGKRLRVTAQLVNVSDGYQVWSERYDRVMADIFDVQDEISLAIVEQLKVKLIGNQRLVTKPTENDEAYQLYLKGRHYWHQRSPTTVRVAIQYFEQAIKLDPRYALAYAGLADCYGILRTYGWLSAEDSRPPAYAAMTQAMTLAPSLWEVNFSRGFYQFYFERGWREAGPYFSKAIAINPRSPLAQAYYGVFLATEGRAEEAVAPLALACELDPLSPLMHGITAAALLTVGRFDDAERVARRALELQPDYLLGLWILGGALSGIGRDDEAIEAMDRTCNLSRAPTFVGSLGLIYARAGRPGEATGLLRELEERGSRGEYVPAFARLTIAVGQRDLAAIRRTLSEALAEDTAPFSPRVACGPFLEEFRSDPEIGRLLSELYGPRNK